MGSSTENSAFGPSRNPWDPDARARRLRRRLGRGGHRRARALGARLGHRRLDQAALGALRQRRPAAHVRHRLALRRRRLRVEPRPDRPGREDRARRRAPVLDHRRPRPARLDHRGAPRAGAASGGRLARRRAHRRTTRAERAPRASSRACATPSSGRSRSRRSSARRWGSARCRAPSATGFPATT